MGIQATRDAANEVILTLGKSLVNVLFPNDFEYYLIAFELVDSVGRPVEYLTLPIMPDQYTESKQEYTTIRKTAGGITSIHTPNFVPRRISFKGNFGRGFKMNIGQSESFSALRFSTVSGVYKREEMNPSFTQAKLKNGVYNPFIKTGYGFIKVLESIIDKASGLDESNRPMTLYFYNQALGNNYIVEPNSIDLSQDKTQSNMIWNYNIQMTAVAPLTSLQDLRGNKRSLVKNLSFEALNRSTDRVRRSIKLGTSVSPKAAPLTRTIGF